MSEDWLIVRHGTAPLVLGMPHTGTDIPAALEPRFVSPWLARKDADWWIDRLYGFAEALDATIVRTRISRSVIDVNRDPGGASLYPGQATTELCPTTTFDGEPLYRPGQTPDAAEIAQRTARWFSPYHAALAAELDRLRARHGRVVLYDCHSIRSSVPRLFNGELPQFNIGTNGGATCDRALEQAVAERCAASGLSHVVNGRFRGGYTTRHHGRPDRGVHAIQMELACRGYIDEPAQVDEANWPPPFDPERAAPLAAHLTDILTAARDWAATKQKDRMTTRLDNSRIIRAPRGTNLRAKSWLTEAPLRMLMNNLDPDVAEKPEELTVYGGIGRAARNWEAYDAIVASLERLEEDQTLLVQSGKPVGIFRTHADAPRVLIANSNLVPHWANWEHFNALDRKGLMMYGQMTAGSWIYIGTQGIVQGTYETFAEMGRQHFGGDLAGRWILTAGLGGMGGAQPLAAVMAGASCIAVECQPSRIEMRLRTGYLDRQAHSIEEALAIVEESHAAGKPVSVGLLGNAAEVYPEMVRRGIRPDAVTDQTSAHDPRNGYLPLGWSLDHWERMRASNPDAVDRAARSAMAVHVRAMLDFHRMGIPVVDYGNNIRQMALEEGVADAFDFPGFVPAYIRPLFCRGVGPFRWAALSGDPEDIYRTDAKVKELLPDNRHLHNWLDMARERIQFQGLPARICWVGLGDRDRLGLAFNEMVARGELKAPIVIGRDHLDSGSVASPNRETEKMQDGSDAVSDWPLLNALLNTASGATWVSLHHGGGVGMGFSQHSGMVIVCDGSEDAARRIARVLWNDPATGVMRHADAGYEIALDCAREKALDLPAILG